MKDVPKGTAADAVQEAMDWAAGFCDNPLEQFKWAEFALYGQAQALAHLAAVRKAWLLSRCNALANVPLRQGHPLDGEVTV